MSGQRQRPDLSDSGIFNIEGLRQQLDASRKVPYRVEGLIAEHSLNLLAGHSALGKTPLAVTLGVAIASGTPFLGHATTKGRVLYCDTESPLPQFITTLERICRQAGLAAAPPEFEVWSPNWDPTHEGQHYGEALLKKVALAEPDLTIVDPLRNFFPEVEQKADDAAKRFNQIEAATKERGSCFLFVHHLRKPDKDAASVVEDPRGWFLNVAGSQAIFNRVNARFGVEPSATDDDQLVIGGIIRGVGPILPMHVTRDYDAHGDILGYRRLNERDFLRDDYRLALDRLSDAFTWTEAAAAIGSKGGSKVGKMLDSLQRLKLITRTDKTYRKTTEAGAPGVSRLAA